MSRILIFAANAQDAVQFLKQHGIPVTSVAYVSDPDRLRGLHNPPFLFTPRFNEHEKATELLEMLSVCYTQGDIVVIPRVYFAEKQAIIDNQLRELSKMATELDELKSQLETTRSGRKHSHEFKVIRDRGNNV